MLWITCGDGGDSGDAVDGGDAGIAGNAGYAGNAANDACDGANMVGRKILLAAASLWVKISTFHQLSTPGPSI